MPPAPSAFSKAAPGKRSWGSSGRSTRRRRPSGGRRGGVRFSAPDPQSGLPRPAQCGRGRWRGRERAPNRRADRPGHPVASRAARRVARKALVLFVIPRLAPGPRAAAARGGRLARWVDRPGGRPLRRRGRCASVLPLHQQVGDAISSGSAPKYHSSAWTSTEEARSRCCRPATSASSAFSVSTPASGEE